MHLYHEFPPHPALAAHIACLWTSRALPAGAPVRHRILPDNCIDILWQDRALPGAARVFFGLPLHALQDDHPALDDLWPRHEAEALAAALWERERTLPQRLAILQRVLLARLRAAAPGPADRLARAAVGLIDQAGGAVRIDELARTLGVSRQHLALQFRERVGLPPKTFAMVSRFRRAGAALRLQSAGQFDWARLALDCGYYDQSHLIHEFRLFADETPERFARPRA